MPAWPRWIIALAILGLTPLAARAEPRYLVQFRSGKRATGNDIQNWHETEAEPQLGTQRLFFPGDRPLWIEDRTIEPVEPTAEFIEFVNGDRLPGQVVEYRTGRESPYRQFLPHFFVNVGSPSDLPDQPRSGVPIAARWLKRIVWQKIPAVRATPGTLVYRDGRHIPYQSLRFSARSVRVLLENESRSVPFAEIAEISFPTADSWTAWLDQLSVAAPSGTDLLIQVETAEGHRITTSTARLQIQNRDPRNPTKWFHGFQPAWALEPLWLNHRSIRMRRYFEPQFPLLTLFEPSKADQKSTFGGSFPWQRDKSVRNLPLRCGAQSFGWGLGVQARSTLTWELPPFAVAFSSQYGLDIAAGSGGCVHCAIYGGPPTGKPLYQSPVLVGSTRPGETGRVVLPGEHDGKRQIMLVVDPRIDDHPEGADPFEIRDLFDWLEPQVELDLPGLKRDLSRRASQFVPAWQDWKLVDAESLPVQFATRADGALRAPHFVTGTSARSNAFTLTRTLAVSPNHRFLMISATRLDRETPAARLAVRIDNESVGSFDVPLRDGTMEADPILVPLDRWRGKSVGIEITQTGGAQARVDWRGISLLPSDPRVHVLLDDAVVAGLQAVLTAGTGRVTLSDESPFAGRTSLLIADGSKETSELPGGPIAIREFPALGEYRYLRFAWRSRSRLPLALHLARDDEWGASEGSDPRLGFRYRAGGDLQNGPGPAYELGAPSKAWEVVTRDLFADFGSFDLTGLRFSANSEGTAEFDEIVFARREEDLKGQPQR